MLFAIDIDQTISTGFVGTGLKSSIAYYTSRGIFIPAAIQTYPELFQLPEVILLHEDLPGAIEKVKLLSRIGRVCYYTVRKHHDPDQEKAIHEATKHWLFTKQFPNPDHVVFCRSPMHKLIRLHELEKESQEPLVLIDDRYQKLIEHFGNIASGEHSSVSDYLKQYLTLIAFGATSSLPEITNGLRVVALPSWENFDDRYASLFSFS